MNIILQGKIEEAIKKMSHDKTSFWEDYDYSIKDIEEIIYDACELTAVHALQNQWISVDEELPDENGRYLVYAPTYKKGSSSGLDFKDGIGFSRFCNGKWSIEIGYIKRPNCVTHWMSIPEIKGGE